MKPTYFISREGELEETVSFLRIKWYVEARQ